MHTCLGDELQPKSNDGRMPGLQELQCVPWQTGWGWRACRYCQWEAGKATQSNNLFSFIFCFSVFLAGLLECTLNNWNSSCNEILWIMGLKRKRWCLEFRSGALEYWSNIDIWKCNACVQYSSLFSIYSAFLWGCCQIGAETAVAATVSRIFPARSLWMWIEI